MHGGSSRNLRTSFHRAPMDMEYAVAELDVAVPMAQVLGESDKYNDGYSSKINEKSQSHQHHTGSEHPGANTHNIKPWPPALRDKLLKTFKRPCDERRGGAVLQAHDWPEGLRTTVYKSCKKIPLRFFIVDDSGSMILNDGKKIIKHNGVTKMVKCTRWAELTETMHFLAELSEALRAPSEFRLLNGADPIIVGLGDDNGESLKFLKEVMEDSPAGPTPLCTQLNAVVESILSIADVLRANNQKVTVMIATDGESSDGNVADALRPLTNLPVLVILRLCTSEDKVVNYWNNIDQQLELDIDVLDDPYGDAKQVNQHNPWLTYGEPLHRLREFGASMKEMDIIDESTVSSEQMRVLCAYIYLGGNLADLPHPDMDWRAFVQKIKELNRTLPPVFDPLTSALRPWVDVKKLNTTYSSDYGEGGGSASCVLM